MPDTTQTLPGPSARPLGRRAKASADRRDGIIAAARHSFETAGYHATTLRGIAKAAKVSTGAVFSNFSGKDELYVLIFGHAPVSPEEGRALRRQIAELRSGHRPVSQLPDDMSCAPCADARDVDPPP